ncbi:MAG TPA: nucleotide-binding protein [Solirubrobacterales bacterium]
MPFHAKIYWGGRSTYLFNLEEEDVKGRIARAWDLGKAIVIRGQQYNRGEWMASVYEYGKVGQTGEDFSKWFRIETNGRDATDDFIVDPYGSGRPTSILGSAIRPAPREPDLATPDNAPQDEIADSVPPQEAVDPRNVMVVHGRDLVLRDDMFALLRALGLAPLEWSQLVALAKEGAPYVGRVLERAFEVAQAAIVLFSPDDEARLAEPLRNADDSANFELQARPNVFFEAGLAFGSFPDKSVLVEFGNIRTASDLAGRHVVRFDGGAEKRHELAERLASAGCPVDRSGTDWLRVGNFQPAVNHKSEQ